MSEETRRILDMVKNNVITEEEGETLIEALYEREAPKSDVRKKSTLRVIIDSDGNKKNDKAIVKVNVPLVLAKKLTGLMNLVPKSTRIELNEQGIDLNSIDLTDLIEMFERGEIEDDLVNIDVDDNEDKAKVRIYVD